MRVASLHIYPVKSFAGLDVDAAEVEPRGLSGDRRMMLVDDAAVFVTQRDEPRLARLRLSRDGDGFTIAGEGLVPLPIASGSGERIEVRVWEDVVDAATLDPAIDTALSSWLGRPVRLVAMDGRSRRGLRIEGTADAEVGFADAYPVLFVTAASLDALNERIAATGEAPVPMGRFRPNIVIDGATPWADDAWTALRIGEVRFDLVSPCTRCIVTTTDQGSGVRISEEPLRTLTSFRRSVDPRVRGVLFGWNAVPRSTGTVRRGDPVEVVGVREPWPVR